MDKCQPFSLHAQMLSAVTVRTYGTVIVGGRLTLHHSYTVPDVVDGIIFSSSLEDKY